MDRLNDSKLKLIPPKDLIRIQAMIIPSVFRSLVASGELDPTLLLAGARAHNRWLAELCADSPDRCAGVAIVRELGAE